METNWKSDHSPRRQSMSHKADLHYTQHIKWQIVKCKFSATNKRHNREKPETASLMVKKRFNKALKQSKFLTALWFSGGTEDTLPSHWVEGFGPFCRRFVKAPSAHLCLKPCSRQDKCWTPSSWTFYSFKMRLKTVQEETWSPHSGYISLTLECDAISPHGASTQTPTVNRHTSCFRLQNKTPCAP